MIIERKDQVNSKPNDKLDSILALLFYRIGSQTPVSNNLDYLANFFIKWVTCNGFSQNSVYRPPFSGIRMTLIFVKKLGSQTPALRSFAAVYYSVYYSVYDSDFHTLAVNYWGNGYPICQNSIQFIINQFTIRSIFQISYFKPTSHF